MNNPIIIKEITINNLLDFDGSQSKARVMGSPLKHGSINFIVNRMPKFVYEISGDLFYAEDNGFVSIFKRESYDGAFGGSTFDLNMKDGSIYTSKGELWDPFSWEPFYDKIGFTFCRVGISTPDDWKKCSVYSGCKVNLEIIVKMLSLDIKDRDSQKNEKSNG
jgi:hypothetical protein